MPSVLLELLANALDVTVLTVLFCKRLRHKYNTIIPTLVFISCAFIFESLPIFFDMPYYPTEMILFLTCLSYVLFFRDGSLLHKLFWVSISFVVILAISLFIIPVVSLITGIDVKDINHPAGIYSRMLYIVVVNIIKVIVFYLMAYRPRKNQRNHLSMLVCMIIPATSVVFGTVISKIYGQNDTYASANNIIFWVAISYLLVSISSLVLYEIIERDSEKMVYLLAKENQYSTMAQYTEQIKQTNREIRVWQHDMKQHLGCLHALLEKKDYNGADTYLEKFTDQVQLSYMKINSGNYLADAVLSSKVNFASTKRIKVECSASLPESLTIDEVDFCSILSNIFDNAIEACEKIKDNPFITSNIVTIRNQLIINVENSSDGKYRIRNGIYESMKKEGVHGIGLKHTQNIVDKYDGICNIIAGANKFSIEISIPLKNNII